MKHLDEWEGLKIFEERKLFNFKTIEGINIYQNSITNNKYQPQQTCLVFSFQNQVLKERNWSFFQRNSNWLKHMRKSIKNWIEIHSFHILPVMILVTNDNNLLEGRVEDHIAHNKLICERRYMIAPKFNYQ
jgi:hypothetical protein